MTIPAFPTQHTVADANDPAFKLGNSGMTLRDYFAGQYVQGAGGWRAIDEPHRDIKLTSIAAWAYDMADAMLAERERAR